jgi:hypothetical protein
MRNFLILSVFSFLFCRLHAQTTATAVKPKAADTVLQKKMVNNIFQFAGTYFGLAENAGDFKEDRVISRKPAFMNITVPRNGDNSYLVNLALRFNITNLFDSAHLIRKVNIYPYLEWQRNSLVDNQQNNFKYGMALNHRIYKLTNYRLMLETTMGANDSRNFITGVYSHQLSLYTGLAGNKETTSPARYFLPSSVMIPVDSLNKWLEYQYMTYIGLEYSNYYNSPADFQKGYTWSSVFQLNVNLDFFERFLQFNADFQWRNVFSHSSSSVVGQSTYQKYSLNINLLKNVVQNADFLIGVDYIHGENPWLGLEFQDYWRFGFKLRM